MSPHCGCGSQTERLTNCSIPLNVSITEALNGSELIDVTHLAPSHPVQGIHKPSRSSDVKPISSVHLYLFSAGCNHDCTLDSQSPIPKQARVARKKSLLTGRTIERDQVKREGLLGRRLTLQFSPLNMVTTLACSFSSGCVT